MKHEEQLNRYFEHGMTGAEEQNFLISVAASDELRIAFRSQLELLKAVRSDKDALQSGRDGEPVARVRDRTLAALGLSAIAAKPFLDNGQSHMVNQPVVAKMDGIPVKASWLRHLAGTPSITLAAGLMLGVVTTLGIEHMNAPTSSASGAAIPAQAPVVNPLQTPSTISVPAAPNAVNTSANAIPGREPISSGNGLVHSSGHAIHSEHGSAARANHANEAQEHSVPTVSTSTPSTMSAHPATIKKPADSGARN